MTTNAYKIGDVCSITRGVYPTMKTEPGEYPLVVTAAFRRSASTYQMEGPAVCVPLISSTGHGNAALHRVHYQEGKFALANLLVALTPKDNSICDPKYLYHLLMAKKDEYLVPLMLGTANVSFKEQDIAGVEIALPPLNDQVRIVSRIEELAAKVAEATRLQAEITNQLDALCRALIANPPGEELAPTAMNDLLVMREPDVKVQATESYHFAGVYCFGRGVFAGQRKDGSEFAYRSLTRIHKGNFVYPKLMAWEGALGVVPENCDGLYVSPEFPVFEVRQDRVLPEVLDTYFRMPSVWPDLAAISTGTNVRRRRLHPRAFLQYNFPLPSMKVQRQLCVVRRSIDQAKSEQSESAAGLDALMPSILSKAFRGEL
jgi:type I restriction enzyme, S subunit